MANEIGEDSYRQAHEGLLRNVSWIRERPTVIPGDFNAYYAPAREPSRFPA